LEFDRHYNVVGENAQKFASWLGMNVRSHIPLTMLDWRDVTTDQKNNLLREIEVKYFIFT